MGIDASDLLEPALIIAAATAVVATVSAIAMHWRGASSITAEDVLKASAIVGAVALVIAVLLFVWTQTRVD